MILDRIITAIRRKLLNIILLMGKIIFILTMTDRSVI